MKLAALLLLGACSPQPNWSERNAAAAELVDEGRWDEAEDAFGWLYAEGYRPAALGLGICLRERGALEESLWCLQELGPSEDLGFALYALERDHEAAGVFGRILDADPLSTWNLAAALRGTGANVESLFWDVASRIGPHDGLQVPVLMALADGLDARGESEHAGAVFAHAEYLEARRDAWEPDSRWEHAAGPERASARRR